MNCKYCSWAAKLSCAVGTTFPGQWVHWKPPHTTSNFRNVAQNCERHKSSILEHHFLKQCGPGRYRAGGGAFAWSEKEGHAPQSAQTPADGKIPAMSI